MYFVICYRSRPYDMFTGVLFWGYTLSWTAILPSPFFLKSRMFLGRFWVLVWLESCLSSFQWYNIQGSRLYIITHIKGKTPYEVTQIQGSKTSKSFVFFSQNDQIYVMGSGKKGDELYVPVCVNLKWNLCYSLFYVALSFCLLTWTWYLLFNVNRLHVSVITDVLIISNGPKLRGIYMLQCLVLCSVTERADILRMFKKSKEHAIISRLYVYINTCVTFWMHC